MVCTKTLDMARFYLRASVRAAIYGVEEFQEIKVRHLKYAASRFAHKAASALTRFANSSPMDFVNGITRLARDTPHQDARLIARGAGEEAYGQGVMGGSCPQERATS